MDPEEINAKGATEVYNWTCGAKVGVPLLGISEVKRKGSRKYFCKLCTEAFTYQSRMSHMLSDSHKTKYLVRKTLEYTFFFHD